MFYIYQEKWNPIPPDFYPPKEITKIGLRGAPILAPENTIESFTKAFEAGLEGIELDVQLSKDGELVVFHDWNLKKITGSPKHIKDMDYLEIRDISSANNCQIPRLSEVLEICPKGKLIHIEIKSQHYLNITIVGKVVKMIQQYKIEKLVVVSSFNPFVLQFVKKLIPDIFTAYIWSSEDHSFLYNSPLWVWLCRPDAFHIDINSVDKKIIRWARAKKLAILAFTVNNASDLSKARELELDGIFTDDPHLKVRTALS